MEAFLQIGSSESSAKSNNTSTDGPPFICDNNSKAKSISISSKTYSLRIIFLRNLDLTSAALVVPGNTLYIKNSKDLGLSSSSLSIILEIISFSKAASSIGFGCNP